jgi:tetratricopeptide (TPR) repeat protein
MEKWKEKIAFAALALALLVPISILQFRIDEDEVGVAFLRWIDNQEAYERQAKTIYFTSPDARTPEEIALFNQAESTGAAFKSDFRELDVEDKWRVINEPDFDGHKEAFLDLVMDSKITLSEGEIEWSNPDVSANVGALVLGFRKLVADLLWLKVDEFWHLGLASRMLPMMETVVALDPHFIEAYALGAWHLAYNITVTVHSAEEKLKYMDQGVGLLEKGIKNNPRSAKLYAELGFTMYFMKYKDWEKSAYYMGESIKHEHDVWMERAYALALERMGTEETERQALVVIEEYGRKYPDFHAQKPGIDRLRKKLRARELEEAGNLQEAYALWTQLEENDPSDVVAPLEVRRFKEMFGDRTAAG